MEAVNLPHISFAYFIIFLDLFNILLSISTLFHFTYEKEIIIMLFHTKTILFLIYKISLLIN